MGHTIAALPISITVGPRSGCYRNRVKASTIDKYVEDWLVSTGTVLEWCTEDGPITSLYKKVRLVNDRSLKLRMVVENYLADKLATVFPFEEHDGARYFEIGGQEIIETAEGTEIIPITHKFCLPGYTGDPGVLQELLSLVESSQNSTGTVAEDWPWRVESHISCVSSQKHSTRVCVTVWSSN